MRMSVRPERTNDAVVRETPARNATSRSRTRELVISVSSPECARHANAISGRSARVTAVMGLQASQDQWHRRHRRQDEDDARKLLLLDSPNQKEPAHPARHDCGQKQEIHRDRLHRYQTQTDTERQLEGVDDK